MRLCLKVGRQGYNWLFLTPFDFTIIFHLLPCLVWCHYFHPNLTCVTVQFFFHFDILYEHNRPKIKKHKKKKKSKHKKHKKHKIQVGKT